MASAASLNANGNEAYQLHQAEDFKTLKEVSQGFYSIPNADMTFKNEWDTCRNAYIEKHPDVWSRLNITIPPDEMREIFNQYKIIALRRLEHEQLTLCCGNFPIASPCATTSKDEYHGNHPHSNQDTCDLELLMNPSIVADMHSPSLIKYIATQKHQYKHIEAEYMNFCEFDDQERLEQSFTFLQKLLQLNGTYAHTDSTEIIDDPWVQTIQQTAPKYGLEVTVDSKKKREEWVMGTQFRKLDYPVYDNKLTVSKTSDINCEIQELSKLCPPMIHGPRVPFWHTFWRSDLGACVKVAMVVIPIVICIRMCNLHQWGIE